MPKLQEHVPLSIFSNYKIGGPARFFFDATTEADLRWAVEQANVKKLPLFILSGGTNLLIGDEGFDGVVVRPNITFIKKSTAKKSTANGVHTITVGAGTSMAALLDYTIKNSLSGLEWAGGLPGNLGGAVRGNAGCFGGEIKDVIASVRSYDTKAMRFVERSARASAFGYRDSIFKKKNGQEIIVSATLRLIKGNKKEIEKEIKDHIAYRAKNHPLDYPNIGSTFKNVPLERIHKKGSVNYKKAVAASMLTFKKSTFTVKHDPFPVISTAKLISEAGLRGVSLGGAMISPKHPNFIVNVLNADASHVKGLITLAKTEVKKRFGVQLEEEVQII